MFVIPCKYNRTHDYVVGLVEQIRQWHPDERIVVVDSDSEDRSYFPKVEVRGAEVMDIKNHHWMVGAYWAAFDKYPDEEFYYCIHDSMIVKENMDYLKANPVTVFACFERNVLEEFGCMGPQINEKTDYTWERGGLGCCGPIFFCQNKVLATLKAKGADKVLPVTKVETGGMEASFGFFFEQEGYDIDTDKGHNLYGNILQLESPKGKSGLPPHKTAWQYPIEKFYASHRGEVGDGRNKDGGFGYTGH